MGLVADQGDSAGEALVAQRARGPCTRLTGADDLDHLDKLPAHVAKLVRAAWELGGTLTGEHGVGVQKRPWLAEELGDAEMERQRAVKALFDPLGIMNPGRGIA